ncbi:target of EGR1 protein 1-like isoform X2 [Tigriopus californicus]|nr:target of EGR1 protein 1-like isoform X2 [Tigriopus californicus]
MNAVAQTRSIVALGLSTFHHRDDYRYQVDTFNLMALCSEDYIVEPGALKFLVEHGFDFQKQYSSGLPYCRGKLEDNPEPPQPSLRRLFQFLVKCQKPLVVHNGLIDLVFLYQSLYAQLPSKLETFVADLTAMFPQGLYDTKYIADYITRHKSSYLEYVFRKEQITNQIKASQNRPHVQLQLGDDETISKYFQWIQYRWCGIETAGDNQNLSENGVCENFANHGHCVNGQKCTVSHNIDDILSHKESKKWKRDWKTANPEEARSNGSSDESQSSTSRASDRHRAGFDAFMTGFAFATYLVHFTKMPKTPLSFASEHICTESSVNKLYLVCKDFPLNVMKSLFARYSIGHHEALKAIKAASVQSISGILANLPESSEKQ